MSPNMYNGGTKGDSEGSSTGGTLRSTSGVNSLSAEINLSNPIDRVFEKLPKLHAKSKNKKAALSCYRYFQHLALAVQIFTM